MSDALRHYTELEQVSTLQAERDALVAELETFRKNAKAGFDRQLRDQALIAALVAHNQLMLACLEDYMRDEDTTAAINPGAEKS